MSNKNKKEIESIATLYQHFRNARFRKTDTETSSLCRSKKPCFGRSEKGVCKILIETYPPETCPFQKKENQ